MTLITDNEITQNDLLASLAAELRDRQRRPGDVTINDLMDATGCTYEVAKDTLERKYKAGELQRREIYNEDGRRVLAYFRG